MNPEEAMRYLGIKHLEQLEDAILDYGVDVDLDDDGNVLEIMDPQALREPLFQEHRKKIGHRPDDPKKHAEAKRLAKEKREKEKEDREKKKIKLAVKRGRVRPLKEKKDA